MAGQADKSGPEHTHPPSPDGEGGWLAYELSGQSVEPYASTYDDEVLIVHGNVTIHVVIVIEVHVTGE